MTTDIKGYYTTDVEFDDVYDLHIELVVYGTAYYYPQTRLEPAEDGIDIDDYKVDCLCLMDKEGNEIPDSPIYDELREALDAKVNEVFGDISEYDVSWEWPEPDYPDYEPDDF